MTLPERPPSLPAGAVYNADTARWETNELNELGERHGAFAAYAADGTLLLRGTYANGKPDGFVSRYADGSPGGARLRDCCVPPGARELRERYRNGRFLDEVFFDERGRPLCDDGTPWPERAASIPEHAYWVPSQNTFVEHRDNDDGTATQRYFTLEGALTHEFDTERARGRARRRFADNALCVEETGLDEQGKNDGPYVERFLDGTSPYVDRRIVELRGRHAHGERVGSWEFVDRDGAVLARAEYGDAWGQTASETALGTGLDVGDAEARWQTALRLWQQHDARNALAMAARALAANHDVTRFTRFLAERVTALEPTRAQAYAKAADEAGASPGDLLGALLGGAEPAATLCTLAMALPGSAPAALDYAEASLALSPTRERSLVARAFLRIERGDPDGALDDAASIATESETTASFVRDLCRIAYPRFGFSPDEDPVSAPDEELVSVEATQPLDAVRRCASLYATRLTLVRRALVQQTGGVPAWLPPDLGVLLPDGLLALERGTLRIEDEGDEGVEISDVEFDETLDLARSTRALLTTARGDWAALCWLCWTAGLDRVALPETLTPRALFPAAAHRTTLRCWRVNDRLRSAGLVAQARQVPSFDWEGMRIDAMPAQFVEVALVEYTELRALFFWLLFPQNKSVFQADLRKL